MAQEIKTTNLPQTEHSSYKAKARQFFNVMKMCLADKEWDAVLLNGVHAAISMNDALCIFLSGKRSISKMHQDAVKLLMQVSPHSEESKKNAHRLADILNLKHHVEYEPRRFAEKEARDFSNKVERFFSWVEKQIP